MSFMNDCAYYRERARSSMALADAAMMPGIAAIHRRMHDAYLGKAAEAERGASRAEVLTLRAGRAGRGGA